MSFGQASGPPASAKQVSYLLSLVKAAGHDDFRSARHPLGLTQRQAGGKFTTREASELIDRLVNGESTESDNAPPPAPERPVKESNPLSGFPTAVLADELRRRGYVVNELKT